MGADRGNPERGSGGCNAIQGVRGFGNFHDGWDFLFTKGLDAGTSRRLSFERLV